MSFFLLLLYIGVPRGSVLIPLSIYIHPFDVLFCLLTYNIIQMLENTKKQKYAHVFP